MTTLAGNWLTSGLIDFEYKKYVLLGYLQKVQKHFTQEKLYPFFSQLIAHYKQLQLFHDAKNELQTQFPRTLSGIDLKNQRLYYTNTVAVGECMEEIERILTYALQEMATIIEAGKKVYTRVEQDLDLFHVGINSLHKKEGYLLIELNESNKIKVFSYKINHIHQNKEPYIGINVQYVSEEKKYTPTNFEQLKMKLIRKEKCAVFPATFAATSKQTYPFKETLFPIVKRLLIQQLSEKTDKTPHT